MPRGVGKSRRRRLARVRLLRPDRVDRRSSPGATGTSAWSASPGSAPSRSTSRASNPPHLKAIFPFDPRGAYGTLGGFREEYPGGVVHLFRYLVGHFGVFHQDRAPPGELPPEKRAAVAGGDGRPRLPDVPARPQRRLAMKGQHMPAWFRDADRPLRAARDAPSAARRSSGDQHSRLHGIRLVRLHVQDPPPGRPETGGACRASPRSCCSSAPRTSSGRSTACTDEILRWHDHWLKGIDTGVLDEPPVRYWVMGANEWRTAEDWPLPETSGRSST